ncbi:hypothetical protein H5410_003344, partial [Solanum commersonii]
NFPNEDSYEVGLHCFMLPPNFNCLLQQTSKIGSKELWKIEKFDVSINGLRYSESLIATYRTL